MRLFSSNVTHKPTQHCSQLLQVLYTRVPRLALPDLERAVFGHLAQVVALSVIQYYTSHGSDRDFFAPGALPCLQYGHQDMLGAKGSRAGHSDAMGSLVDGYFWMHVCWGIPCAVRSGHRPGDMCLMHCTPRESLAVPVSSSSMRGEASQLHLGLPSTW